MTEPAQHPRRRAPQARSLRIFLRGLAFLCLTVLAACASLYLLCVYKPELVAATVQKHLSDATGMPWRIKGVIRPVLTPFPGLVISDVALVAATTDQRLYANSAPPLAHVPKLRLYVALSFFPEVSLRFRLIELIDPVVTLAYDMENRPLWLPLPESAPGSGEPVGQPAPQRHEALKRTADAVCTLFLAAMPPVAISNGSVMSYADDGRPLLSFTGIDGTVTPDVAEENVRLSTTFFLPDADLVVRFFLSARMGCEGIPARGNISGRVEMTPPGSRTVSGDFESGFLWQKDGRHILLPDFRMVAETDAISADLVADLATPECTGKVQIHKLSLPRWFQFGRVLSPGLRQALDGLIGEFDLQLDLTRAEARNLRGIAGPLPVSGYVGTPDFSAPVVVVDLDVDRVNLDLVFPFLAVAGKYVPEPAPPIFDHLPLAPYPEDPNALPLPPDALLDSDVGYDVTVRVARPRVHDVDGGALDVRVFPATVDGAGKTRVTFTASSLLEGNVDGRLDIDTHGIRMHYDAKGLELRHLPENAENTVKVAGRVTGICEIDVPMLENGALADDWKIRVNAAIKDCDITGEYVDAPWRLSAGTVGAAGQGSIYAVPSRGIRIEGVWDLEAAGIKTSWFPKGNDGIRGNFAGGLHWPPMADAPRAEKKTPQKIEVKGVDKVAGKLRTEGSLMVPLGSLCKPVTGSLSTDLDWRPYEESISLHNTVFEGVGGSLTGDANIDFSGREVTAASEMRFTIHPDPLLRSWNALPPKTIQLPQLLAGTSAISGRSRSLRFDEIKAELDGARVSGAIFWQGAAAGASDADNGLWTFRLAADSLDLDKYFPAGQPPADRPAPKTPWDLSFMKGLGVDARITLHNAKKDKLNFGQAEVTAALQRGRFSLHAESVSFYGGAATLLAQGTAVPERSQILLRKGLIRIDNADIGKIFHDYSGESSYGGKASLVVDVAGSMDGGTDVPATLSGVWNLTIADGLYPAFLGGKNSTQRNSFSLASAGGVLEKGVLRSDNFRLTGPMVDMSGGGWYNLVGREYDMEVSVTFAKVPTVPVRFYGSAQAPRMKVRGVDMVVETVQNAGTTMFGLIRGVFLLPAYALTGVGELFGGNGGDKQPARTMPLAPMRQQTGHPGQ